MKQEGQTKTFMLPIQMKQEEQTKTFMIISNLK